MTYWHNNKHESAASKVERLKMLTADSDYGLVRWKDYQLRVEQQRDETFRGWCCLLRVCGVAP